MIDSFTAGLKDSEETDAESLALQAPQANAYEFQSGAIVEMLQKLLDKFDAERTTLEREEKNARHAFQMLVQDLTASIEQDTAAIADKKEMKAKKEKEAAEGKADVEDTTATMEDDKKYLADLTATCAQKASDFEERQKLRGEEIEAIEKAIEIISSSAVQGNAEKHLPMLLQAKDAALMQLRADGRSPTQERVATYLSIKAKHLHSRVLLLLLSVSAR